MIATIVPMLGVMLHCAYNVYLGNALETYNLVIMDHPVLTSLDVSYLEVLVGDAMALLALTVGLIIRYRYYEDERDFVRRYNIKSRTGFGSGLKPKSSSVGGYDSEVGD